MGGGGAWGTGAGRGAGGVFFYCRGGELATGGNSRRSKSKNKGREKGGGEERDLRGLREKSAGLYLGTEEIRER